MSRILDQKVKKHIKMLNESGPICLELPSVEALTLGLTIDTSPNVAMAKARLDRAELDLSRTVIRAPFDGVVTNKQVQVGERVAAGAPLMIVVPVASVYVDANFKESQFERLRIGQSAELTSDYQEDRQLQAAIMIMAQRTDQKLVHEE